MSALNQTDLTAAVAIHLEIESDSIIRVEEWASVIFVVTAKGGRFVAKRVLEIAKANRKSANGQVLRVKSIKRVAVNLYQVTMLEKAERKLLSDVVASTYLLTRDEAVSIWGRCICDELYQATIAA